MWDTLLGSWQDLRHWLASDTAAAAIRSAFWVFLGIPLILLLSLVTGRMTRHRFSEQSGMVIRKAVAYLGFIIIVIAVLSEFNFKLTALLGAAGIAAVAIGFAAQTSLSNIISGIFLIWEKPFAVGNFIQVGEIRGTVLSIDLLSVKVRTLDNRFVRIPNENLIKTEVTNITRFPIRRIDMDIGVAYKEDVARVTRILLEVARDNPDCLDEPEPVVQLRRFGDSALEFLFGVWCVSTEFFRVQHALLRDVKGRFDAEGIEIPFPHRTIYAGAATAPLPVRVVKDDPLR